MYNRDLCVKNNFYPSVVHVPSVCKKMIQQRTLHKEKHYTTKNITQQKTLHNKENYTTNSITQKTHKNTIKIVTTKMTRQRIRHIKNDTNKNGHDVTIPECPAKTTNLRQAN